MKKEEILSLKSMNFTEEQIKYVKQLLLEKEKEIDILKRDLQEANKEKEKLLKRLNLKTYIIKKHQSEIYGQKSESNKKSEDDSSLHTGRPKGSKSYMNYDLESMASKTIVISSEDKICDKCGGRLIKFGEDTTYKIVKQPATIEVIKIVNEKYKCSKCRSIFQKRKDDPFSNSPLTASLGAFIVDAKYGMGVPLYRLSNYFNSQGIPFSPQVLSTYMGRISEKLTKLYDAIKQYIVNDSVKVLYADETPIEVIDNFKEGRQTSYMYVVCSSYYNNPIYLYEFSKTRKIDNFKKILGDYKGYLVVDGYAGYRELKEQGIKIQSCWTHLRRYFYDIVKTLKEDEKANSASVRVVEMIDKVFAIEARFKDKKLTPEEILKKRNSGEYLTMINALESYVKSLNTIEQSPLGKAVKYFNNQWEECKTFLECGEVEISNNISERAVKPFALCRRNFLFVKTEDGGTNASKLFSIYQTAKANLLVPDLYLEYVLNKIDKIENIDDLLPWSNKLPKHIKLNVDNINEQYNKIPLEDRKRLEIDFNSIDNFNN